MTEPASNRPPKRAFRVAKWIATLLAELLVLCAIAAVMWCILLPVRQGISDHAIRDPMDWAPGHLPRH